MHRSLETILADALEISSEAERDLYLARVCGMDTALRQEAERLIACHLAADERFLQSPQVPTFVVQNSIPSVGAQIGPYKLREQIGEGGMGIVYLAEQMQPIRRRVALKIIKPGMDSRQVVNRFESERQALAMMDHPNIARVLDAGVNDMGLPYFVMELVQGLPLTEYCDSKRLTQAERIALFLPVCQAVQHAHQKGIIHRDLKPSNVMVTMIDGKPVPKVIDFGIAKSHRAAADAEHDLHRVSADSWHSAVHEPRAGGIQRDRTSTTRSDIYSLGVMLYELLTGQTPSPPKHSPVAVSMNSVVDCGKRSRSGRVHASAP